MTKKNSKAHRSVDALEVDDRISITFGNIFEDNFETSIKTLDLGVLANVINFYWNPPKNSNGSQYTFIRGYHFEYSTDNINWISYPYEDL